MLPRRSGNRESCLDIELMWWSPWLIDTDRQNWRNRQWKRKIDQVGRAVINIEGRWRSEEDVTTQFDDWRP